MKKILICTLLIIISSFNQSCRGQDDKQREIYDEDFKWSIAVPENFEEVSAEDLRKQQQKGADAFENTLGKKVENRAKNVFVFRNGQFNLFESNYQTFYGANDSHYSKLFDEVNEMVYETFMSQTPRVEVDQQRDTTLIDNLEFQSCKMKVTYPTNMILYIERYSRFFEDKLLNVTITYVDKEIGERMRQSLLNSTFEK